MVKKGKHKGGPKPKTRVSAADLAVPAAVIVLAATEEGSQGGVSVLEEGTTYVMDQIDAGNGLQGALDQGATAASDLVSGAVSVDGLVILGAGFVARHYLKRHGKNVQLAKTSHHRITLGG